MTLHWLWWRWTKLRWGHNLALIVMKMDCACKLWWRWSMCGSCYTFSCYYAGIFFPMSTLGNYLRALIQGAVRICFCDRQLLAEAKVTFPRATLVRNSSVGNLPVYLAFQSLSSQFPYVFRQLGVLAARFMSEWDGVIGVSSLEGVFSQPEVGLCGPISCCDCCLVNDTLCQALAIQGAISRLYAVTCTGSSIGSGR